MIAKYYTPASSCSQLINHYIFLQLLDSSKPILDKFIPDGYTSLVFNFKSDVFFIKKEIREKLPKFVIVTPSMESLQIEANPPVETFVVVCKTTVFSRLFDINMEILDKNKFQIIDIFNNDSIIDKLGETKTPEQKIKIIETFLLKEVFLKDYIPDKIDLIYDKIMKFDRPRTISEIINEEKINQRSFRRKFIKRTGLCAKSLLRLVRVNFFWNMIRMNHEMDLNQLIYKCSYFDQSHFIKDFKEIIGETPKSFFNRNLENVKILSGK